MHYAGSRNSIEHGLPLLEAYCLSINCFAAARSLLTAESDRVALVLKRLALSCFELLLSVPENEIPFEAWVQFHHSVQVSLAEPFRSSGGDFSLPSITRLSLLPVEALISLEGEGFMEMRVKHLQKMGEIAKAVVLAKACTECSFISNQATFHHTYVSLLCHLLPNEEAIMEISRLDCKDVLEITCNLETEGEENTAYILCTTFLTQQLQQQSLYCSWELTLLWSKLQRRIDPSLMSLLDRCLQLGAIAKTVDHLLSLVRVIQTEAEEIGVPASVELCVKALQLPKQDDTETRISICKTVSRLLTDDLEVLRACLLTEFLLGPNQEVFSRLEELHLRPDQKYDQENEVIPNSLRCELLLVLKAYWPFDPEFWDWKTLKYHCSSFLGLMPESESEEEGTVDKQEKDSQPELQGFPVKLESDQKRLNGTLDSHKQQDENVCSSNLSESPAGTCKKKHKFCCRICKRVIADTQIIHHSKRHAQDGCHTCPVCLEKFKSRKDLVPHVKRHIEEEEPLSNITIDPSLMSYYKSTHDPDVLQHIVQQAKTVKDKPVDEDEHVTFEYIAKHFNLQNRDEYQCPGTGCSRIFKHSKYLYVHLKSEHKGDENVKHFHQMRDKREKCIFCRRHFATAYHYRKHRRLHYGERPYACVVMGCGAQFRSSNELVTHKQTHGYQLNYECELSGCNVTYSDLGQIYHHEAQHFRDAAFTCVSDQCRKYYLSKKEFIKHLSTHNITFSEEDFEAQKKAKQKLLNTVREAPPHFSRADSTEEIAHEDMLNSSLGSCDSEEPKATMTLVAVCFDGSKFTCGFEKCGMTFSRARDVQRHLKCAHPEHLKLENKEHKHDKERDPKSKGALKDNEPDVEHKGQNEPSAHFQPVEPCDERTTLPHGSETNALSLQTKNDEASLQTLASAKPYICEISGCDFRTAQNYSLMRHYSTKHGRTVEQAKRLTSLKATSFKPYACHLCSKSHRQKHALRVHYIHTHKMSQTLVDKISCASVVEPKSQPLANHHVKIKNAVHELPHHQEKKNSMDTDLHDFNDNHFLSEEEAEEHPENHDDGEKKEENSDGAPQQVRTRRVVTRNNLCYILDKFSKPFHCVAKNCDAAFSTQGGLVRHLQLVHHYNRSQLLLDKDEDEHHSPEIRKEPAKKRPLSNSDEPQPQFKCHFANCKASYHLRSSLVRHTRDCHSQPPEVIQCTYEGCTKVFNHNEALKKHMLYSHCEYYDSLVVRLQSSHNKTVAGCQNNVIVAPQKKVSKRKGYSQFTFRSYEEALQMCQDRCLRVAYPCMVQDCESVVTYMGSLHRHYLKVHFMRREDLMKNEDKLVFNAEQLEELIQRNSARLTATGTSVSNEGFKMECEAEPESTDKIKPLLRPVTVDLSPPYSLRFTTEEGFHDVLPSKDVGKMLNGSVLLPSPPVRQPLKRKNELSEQPPNLKDTQPCSPSFDITAYKPVGFESSFLKYIQDTTTKDKNQGPVRRESFRRSCSVKENNQLGVSLTRSKRNYSPLSKRHAVTGDLNSVQNIKSILDKALAGCGDLAIKQLQYLRPVVVLERPVCCNATTTTTPDLFPSETNNSKLLLGS
uniref:Rearranged L-myc fusion n=1 Tax=Takifugu rubripes TaxID=31033 RepID=H2T849_TAKRU